MINRKIIMMLVGVVVIAVCAEIASAEEIPLRENETGTDSSSEEIIEPITLPDDGSEPILIAPSPEPYENQEDLIKEREPLADETVYPEDPTNGEDNPVLIMGAETSESGTQDKVNVSNLPAIALFGAVIILVLGLVLMKKK